MQSRMMFSDRLSDRSADNPQLGDTGSDQRSSTSRIILQFADDPVNHSFLNDF